MTWDQQFKDLNMWIAQASRLTEHPNYDEKYFRAVCFDTKGRHCRQGMDFRRAEDEDCYPIKWLWPDQISMLAAKWVAEC